MLIPPRQLSQGYFSHANQKSLTGHGTKLPIYRARMPGDNRLVVCKGLFAIRNTQLTALPSIKSIVDPISATPMQPIPSTNAKVFSLYLFFCLSKCEFLLWQ